MDRQSRLIDLSEVAYIPPWKIIERDFEKYAWEDDEKYLKIRLNEILEQLDEGYDIELGKEKQALYFINDFHVRFM